MLGGFPSRNSFLLEAPQQAPGPCWEVHQQAPVRVGKPAIKSPGLAGKSINKLRFLVTVQPAEHCCYKAGKLIFGAAQSNLWGCKKLPSATFVDAKYHLWGMQKVVFRDINVIYVDVKDHLWGCKTSPLRMQKGTFEDGK